MAPLGLVQVARLEMRHVWLLQLITRVVRLPISVNVVPVDLAAGVWWIESLAYRGGLAIAKGALAEDGQLKMSLSSHEQVS